MVKKPLIRKVVRDTDSRFGGPRVVSRPESEGYTDRMNHKTRRQENRCRKSPTPVASYSHQYQIWAMICLDERMHVHIESSPDLKQHLRELFPPRLRKRFLRYANMGEPVVHASTRDTRNHQLDPGPESSVPLDRRASDTSRSRRKRGREESSVGSRTDSYSEGQADKESGEVQETGFKYESIEIGDTQAIETFYLDRFRWIQQLMCKPIAVNWIKYIEPRKLSKYPYNGHKRQRGDRGRTDQAEQRQERVEVQETGEPDGELTKPPWWPPQGCHYMTPTHQKKESRLVLLVHLLRNVHRFKKGITSRELKAVTDKLPLNEKQKRWLNEIYDLRRHEERFLNEEYDTDVRVSVRVGVEKLCKKRRPSRKEKTISPTRKRGRAPPCRDNVVMSRTPSPSSQGRSEPISPVDNTEIEEQHEDRFSEADFLDAQANNAVARRSSDLTNPLQEMSLSQYAPGSTTDNAGQRTQDEAQATSCRMYTETEMAIEAQNLGSISRRPSFEYAMPKHTQTSDRTQMDQTHFAPQPPAIFYDNLAPPSASQDYWNQSQWNQLSPQTIVQNPFQLSPTISGDTRMPGFQPQQLRHAPPPNPAASRNVSYPIEAYDSTSSFPTTSFGQGPHELPIYGYQMGENHFDLR